jgi:hypothetical protein
MRRALLFLALVACGGGGSSVPVDNDPPSPPVEYVLTENHRFGLRNDWILPIAEAYVESIAVNPDGTPVAAANFTLPHFTHGATWESPEGFDIPDGAYTLVYTRVPGGKVVIVVEYWKGHKDAKVLR